MMQPNGFVKKDHEKRVCELHRSIYGLKQASRFWNVRFDWIIKTYGFNRNLDQLCVYNRIKGKKVVFLILHVNDILLI